MLLWIDGFDNYGESVGSAPSPTGIMARRYSYIYYESNFKVRDGRIDGYGISPAVGGGLFGTTSLTTDSTLIIGIAIQVVSAWPSSAILLIRMRDGTTEGMGVYITTAGELQVRRGTTILDETSGNGLTLGSWAFIEFKVTCNDTTGSYELKVGGATVLSDTNVDTKAGSNNYHDNFYIGGFGGASYYPIYDDLYCCDSTGSYNNDFLGNRRVVSIYPDGDDTTEFATSTGANHYTEVNETVLDEDSTYVEDANSANLDLFTYSSVGSVGGICGIQINTDCRETDATSFDIITSAVSGNVNSDDAGQAIASSSYVTRSRIMETDPNTNAPWEISGLDAAKFGFKVD